MLLVLVASSCSNIQNNENGAHSLSEEDSVDSLSPNDNPSIKVSKYTGLNDGYDFENGNDIDSLHIVRDNINGYHIIVYDSKQGFAYDWQNEKYMEVSEFFSKATLEDIDALFVKKSVPIEMSREYTGRYTPNGTTVMTFETYRHGMKQVDKIKFDPRYEVEYSTRFENLYLRLYNIGRLLYGDDYLFTE